MKVKNNNMRMVFNIILNIAFAIIGITMMIKTTSMVNRVFIFITLLLVLGFNIHYDYLKYKLNIIMKNIALAKSYIQTQQKIDHLNRIDKLNGVKTSLYIPQVLLFLDGNKPQEALDFMEKNHKFFTSKPDYLLIKNFTIFKAHSLMANTSKTLASYSELKKMKESNFKSKHMNLLYNWDEIEALQLMSVKKYRQALELLLKINDNYLNPREQVHLYHEIATCYDKTQNKAMAEEYQNKIIAINPESPFITLNRKSIQ